jgi:hypothetical protein
MVATTLTLACLIVAYVCIFLIGVFELFMLIKIFSGKYAANTRNILLLLVISLIFAGASAQIKFQIDAN